MFNVRNRIGIIAACIPLALLLGCSHNDTVVTPPTGASVGAFNPQGETAGQIQTRIDAVKANTQASDEQKQMVLDELKHAQANASK
jgi:hypothetical protein